MFRLIEFFADKLERDKDSYPSQGFIFLRIVFYFSLIICLALCIVANFVIGEGELLDSVYRPLRGSFVTGFITMASFLFSMKTNIVFKLKTEIYDQKEYRLHAKSKLLNPKDDCIEFYYRSLISFSDYISGCIFLALTASVLNILLGGVSIGFFQSMCLCVSISSISCLIFGWVVMNQNLQTYWEYVKAKKSP